ncbi:hypothetical protein [Roseateles sp.]|uniref:hypothetical protein n=1 Tax=Roseateles sp. TaxID=1971397 RepID=UPI002F41CBD6
MSNHTSHELVDTEHSVPGHTFTVVYVHQTRSMGLHCEEDGWFGGSFRPDRWRDKHMTEAWQKHLDHAATGAVIEHGRAENVTEKICVCVTCSIAWRQVNR